MSSIRCEAPAFATLGLRILGLRVTAAIGAGAAVMAVSSVATAGPIEPLPEAALDHVQPIELVAPLALSEQDSIAALLKEVRPRVLSLSARLQCVPYARAQSRLTLRGDANTWWAQAEGRYVRSSSPSEGSVLVLRGYNTDRRGHVAVVRRVLSERRIVIDHANWLNQGEITVDVPVEDVSAAGDWSRVRVWHVPGRAWGGRVYGAQGFIKPNATTHAEAASTPVG